VPEFDSVHPNLGRELAEGLIVVIASAVGNVAEHCRTTQTGCHRRVSVGSGDVT